MTAVTTRSSYLWRTLTMRAPQGSLLALLQHSLPGLAGEHPEITIEATPVTLNDDDGGRSAVPPSSGSGSRLAVKIGGLPAGDSDGAPLSRTFTDELAATEWCYGVVHNALMDDVRERGWLRIHAALVELESRHVLIAGWSGQGKTTLALALGLAGGRIHSDEGVLLRGGKALGLPRRMHLRESSRHLFPERVLADAVPLPYPETLWTLDPGALPTAPLAPASPIQLGPEDIVVVLGDRDAPDLTVTPLAASAALWELVPDAASMTADRAALIREAATVLNRVRVYRVDGYRGTRGREAVENLARHGDSALPDPQHALHG